MGSLLAGQCTAGDKLTYFHTMIEKLNLDVQLLLCLGMDGPNVNKCFQNKLGEEFLVKANISWNMSSAFCFNCIFRRFKKLAPDIDLNQFTIDLRSFFKYSSD